MIAQLNIAPVRLIQQRWAGLTKHVTLGGGGSRAKAPRGLRRRGRRSR